MGVSQSEAQEYIDYWSSRYSNAYEYRYEMMEHAKLTGYVPCIDGGTIYVGKYPELPKVANYPVQRAALSIMAKALSSLHYSLLDINKPYRKGAMLLAAVHDEVICETPGFLIDEVEMAMKASMVTGYLSVFPSAPVDNLIEGGGGKTWADLK